MPTLTPSAPSGIDKILEEANNHIAPVPNGGAASEKESKIQSVLVRNEADLDHVVNEIAMLLKNGKREGTRLQAGRTLLELHGYLKANNSGEDSNSINIVIGEGGNAQFLCPQR